MTPEAASPPHRKSTLRTRLDAAIASAVRAISVLVLPLALLLFLQWPLREVVQAYSREANDLAQILFALYVSVAITAATRADSHLAVDAWARRHAPPLRARLRRLAAVLVLVPWSAFVLWVAWPGVWQSLRVLEGFSETYNPGYFLIRSAVALLALGVLAQGLLDAVRGDGDPQ